MAENRWTDLGDRTLYGIAIAVVGIIGIFAGGIWFQMLAVFCTAMMVWELWMMMSPDHPRTGALLAALSASVLSGMIASDEAWKTVLFLIVPLLGCWRLDKERLSFFLFSLGILLAGWGLVEFRNANGLIWLVWLAAVVVVTDIAGYFAGRMIGGPKFWPAISPKKTWSGTVAGWLGAGVLGLGLAIVSKAGLELVLISILLSFASQMGDIAESALKRRMGVKDSSTLIPGHGGVFDRFDALIGAALFMLLVSLVFEVPGLSL